MAALYTEELEGLLKQAVGRRMVMLGVFSADLLPSANSIHQNRSSCCFAVNTDPSNRPGKHWILFITCWTSTAGMELEYFDSFGMPIELYRDLYDSCVRKGLVPLIKQRNTLMLQDINTSVCGYYCVLFAYLRATGRSFASAVRFLSHAGSSALVRDNFVVRTVYARLGRTSCSSSNSRILACHSGGHIRQCCCSAAQ